MLVLTICQEDKAKIPKFNGKGFAMWKVKIWVIIVKDGCAIALK